MWNRNNLLHYDFVSSVYVNSCHRIVMSCAGGLFLSTSLITAASAANCSPYPYPTFTSGTTASAVQVTSNFTSIMNCANSKASAGANSDITSLDLGISPGGQNILVYHNGNARYGIGTGTGTLTFFIPSSADGISFGTISFSDGSTYSQQAEISNSGAWQWDAYGAGSLTSDASGNITSSSDERLKTAPDGKSPVQLGSFSGTIYALHPILYRWKAGSGMETEHTYAGFSAQDVQSSIPLAVGHNANGYLTLQDRAVLAAAVNTIKEEHDEIVKLQGEVVELQRKAGIKTAANDSLLDRVSSVMGWK